MTIHSVACEHSEVLLRGDKVLLPHLTPRAVATVAAAKAATQSDVLSGQRK